MSRNQRIGLLLAALLVAVVAVVVAVASGGDDDTGNQAAQKTETTARKTTQGQTGTERTTEQPHETVPPKPKITRIRLRGGQVVGGPAAVKVTKGDVVRIVVSGDATDEIHLHGYDIYKPLAPGKPARFVFTAQVEGIFELESHAAEDAGRDPLIGKLTVEPS
jgi:hypothetical protein